MVSFHTPIMATGSGLNPYQTAYTASAAYGYNTQPYTQTYNQTYAQAYSQAYTQPNAYTSVPRPQHYQQQPHQQHQRSRWNGNFGKQNQAPENAYPSQPSKTLQNVIRFQRKQGITPGRYITDNSTAELRKQYPVSNGSQHRAQENSGPDVAPHLKIKLQNEYQNEYQAQYDQPMDTGPRFGMKMLQKMGWSHGKGLGKYEEGMSEPVIPDSLYAHEFTPKKAPTQVIADMSNKHPVMALTELCTRHKWPAPKFEMMDFAGPDHKKSFLMKLIVNGQVYEQKEPCASKKQAKAEVAAMFLESLGLYDRTKAPSWGS